MKQEAERQALAKKKEEEEKVRKMQRGLLGSGVGFMVEHFVTLVRVCGGECAS